METRISERCRKILLGAIADCCGRLRLCHFGCFLLTAGLAACSTTPGLLVNAESEVYAPGIEEPDDPQTVAVFVNWHQGCVFGECDAPHAALDEQAAACIQSGLQRVRRGLRAIPGPVQLRQDTSALVPDPRALGHPDSRFDVDLVARLRKSDVRYAVVLDMSKVLGTPARVTGLEPIADPKAPSLVLWRRSHRSIDVWVEALLIELDSRRWLGRIRRDFRDSRDHTAGVVLVNLVYPIPRFFEASDSSALISACQEVGKGLGYLLSGQRGRARLRTENAFISCRTTRQVSRKIAGGQCSGEQCRALKELCY